MGMLENHQFELERRVILFKPTTTMPDNSLLGYDGDPNVVVDTNSDGEYLLYHSPYGTMYIQSDGTEWRKKSVPNEWVELGSGSGTVGQTSIYATSFIIGDTAGNTKIINHNLGTTKLHVSTYLLPSFESIILNYEITDISNITFTGYGVDHSIYAVIGDNQNTGTGDTGFPTYNSEVFGLSSEEYPLDSVYADGCFALHTYDGSQSKYTFRVKFENSDIYISVVGATIGNSIASLGSSFFGFKDTRNEIIEYVPGFDYSHSVSRTLSLPVSSDWTQLHSNGEYIFGMSNSKIVVMDENYNFESFDTESDTDWSDILYFKNIIYTIKDQRLKQKYYAFSGTTQHWYDMWGADDLQTKNWHIIRAFNNKVILIGNNTIHDSFVIYDKEATTFVYVDLPVNTVWTEMFQTNNTYILIGTNYILHSNNLTNWEVYDDIPGEEWIAGVSGNGVSYIYAKNENGTDTQHTLLKGGFEQTPFIKSSNRYHGNIDVRNNLTVKEDSKLNNVISNSLIVNGTSTLNDQVNITGNIEFQETNYIFGSHWYLTGRTKDLFIRDIYISEENVKTLSSGSNYDLHIVECSTYNTLIVGATEMPTTCPSGYTYKFIMRGLARRDGSDGDNSGLYVKRYFNFTPSDHDVPITVYGGGATANSGRWTVFRTGFFERERTCASNGKNTWLHYFDIRNENANTYYIKDVRLELWMVKN